MSRNFSEFGGKLVMRGVGGAEFWDFGYRGPGFGSVEEQNAEIDWIESLPDFKLENPEQSIVGEHEDVDLAAVWQHPRVVEALGSEFLCCRQFTGSCVGAGGGNLIATLLFHEVVHLGEAEEIVIPFWPLTYGRSRYHGGMRGRGEGSFESAWSEAVLADGVLDARLPGLPAFRRGDGTEYTSSIEMTWSDGGRIDEKWLTESRRHPFRTAARIRSVDDAWSALGNGYPLGWAGSWGGLMECPVVSNPPVLLNRRRGSWSHKQTVLRRMRHPQLGRLFKVYNQWGLKTHGVDPAGGPPGGYWIDEDNMGWQIRNGEVIAYSGFNGFPARTIVWTT